MVLGYLWSLVGCKQLNSGCVVNGSFFMMWVCIRHMKVPIQPIGLAGSWCHSNVIFRSLLFLLFNIQRCPSFSVLCHIKGPNQNIESM